MYLDFSKVLKSENKKFSDLKLYPRYRFDKLYYKFNVSTLKPFEYVSIRSEWKEIIKMFDILSRSIWEIATFRRRVINWNNRNIERLYRMIFNLELLVRELYERILGVSSEEEIVWKNYVINLAFGIPKQEFKVSKDDARELMPSAGLSAFRITLRQMFQPVLQLLFAIKSDLKENNVDEDKLSQLEDALLLKILPWWYRMFERSIEMS